MDYSAAGCSIAERKCLAWLLLAACALLSGVPGLGFIASAPPAGRPSSIFSQGQVNQLNGQGMSTSASSSSSTVGVCGAALGLAALAAAAARRSARGPAVQCSAVSVGQAVTWNGKSGKVAYFGKVGFAAGEWVGVALDGPGGMHDGTVLGKQYFSCPPGQGVFCQEAMLFGGAAPPAAAPTPSMPSMASTPTASAGDPAISVGAKVMWNGKAGVVKFVGPTTFAQGVFVGVELDAGGGMHDGSVLGKKYFDCKPGHGIFAPAGALKVMALS